MRIDFNDRLRGVMLGTAVGDAMGLPAEQLSPAVLAKLGWKDIWRHRLIWGRGMVSDDTEHTFMVAQSLLRCCDDPVRYQKIFAWKLRWWFVGLPAGVGQATAEALIKLWIGFGPSKSGIKSAGNGPAMRSAILGAFFHNDKERLYEFVRLSTHLTHTDPKALTGALAVAHAAAMAVQLPAGQTPDTGQVIRFMLELAPEDREWVNIMEKIRLACNEKKKVADLAVDLGLADGVTGYIYDTVPVCLYAWLRHYGDLRATVESALNCGGDADTTGAIAGALAGASVGEAGIPENWIAGICDWPRTVNVYRKAADRLARKWGNEKNVGPVRYFWPGVLVRNLVFLIIVLGHYVLRHTPLALQKRIYGR